MPNTEILHAVPLQLLQDKATQLRIDCVLATTEAGSGHPTSCASAAEIVSTLFYSVMRFDPHNPRRSDNDVFVLSKGHAAPLLYAAWAEAGAFPREHLLTLRRLDSDLEGHPTPVLPFVDVATGSLGQGLSAGVGIAYNGKELRHSEQRVYVLMGDGESAEGSIWEAAQWAELHGLSNLCLTIDINHLGQSQPTMLQYDLAAYKRRWESFGWHALTVDGHDVAALSEAYEKAFEERLRPTVVLARTIKGKGLGEDIENREGWHGRALDRETAAKVIAGLSRQLTGADDNWQPNLPSAPAGSEITQEPRSTPEVVVDAQPPYKIGGKEIATRRGFGDGLAALAGADSRILALDGDVKNSTYTDEFEKVAPHRFLECYIAEQNMTGMAMGLAARGWTPFAATFACFLTRVYDFIRMTAISNLNVKFVGSHAGVSIGEDGPSQMGLEDLAMMCAEPGITVLYPSDAVSAWRATWLMAAHSGPGYIRTSRPVMPILYRQDEPFTVGKCKVVRRSGRDLALVVAAGVTLHEALRAYEILREDGILVRVIDLFSVQPIDRDELIASSRDVRGIVITVEDHYEHGGIGDAVLAALAQEKIRCYKLAVREIPHSGKPEQLLEKYGISAHHIVSTVKTAVG